MKTLLCAAVVVLSCGLVFGQQYKVLYAFGGAQAGDGAQPLGNLVFDRAGNLYGTTRLGGATPSCSGCGTVFKLSPNSDGTWTEAILYNFCSDDLCQDGTLPVAGLIFDANGNLYGTTSTGGAPPCPPGTCGTVFEMSSPSLPGAATAPPR
ncbi:MAG: choice-of-anchor tandem repeat GloVer-containing protein [Terriglobales bacterium]